MSLKNKVFPFILVITVELFTIAILFFITPFLAQEAAPWIWIAFAVTNLIVVHCFAMYFLRKAPLCIWLIGIPINVFVICLISLINNQFIIYSLRLYGIFSLYDAMIGVDSFTAPFYIDAISYSFLIYFGRMIFSIPIKFVADLNEIDA